MEHGESCLRVQRRALETGKIITSKNKRYEWRGVGFRSDTTKKTTTSLIKTRFSSRNFFRAEWTVLFLKVVSSIKYIVAV